jgi:dGTPase
LIGCIRETGVVGMRPPIAEALAGLRAFNYERIYTREASQRQAAAVVAVLRALTEYFAANPHRMPDPPPVAADSADAVRAAVGYVAGMTDRYACDMAVALLGWDERRLPAGIDLVPR